MYTKKKVLLALAIMLELLSLTLFLTTAATAVAASLTTIGLLFLIVAASPVGTHRR